MRNSLSGLALGSMLVLFAACGAGSSTVGGSTPQGTGGGKGAVGGGAAGTGGGSATGGGASATGGGSGTGGGVMCLDMDQDGASSCGVDCDDTNKDIYPGAVETLNQKDDDCDGKVDNKIAGRDADMDGSNYPADCNDDEKLVGPNAIEAAGNMVDDNCNGAVDEAVVDCDAQATGQTGFDFAKAIGICTPVQAATFTGNAAQRAIRAKFGDSFPPRAGSKLIHLSSGAAKDKYDDASYQTQSGQGFGASASHPFYTPPKCSAPSTPPAAQDLSELTLTIKVPQNANSLSFNFAFFSAEFPEWVCTAFNDRFLALLTSSALDPSKLPAAQMNQCKTGAAGAPPTCNVSFDATGQPVSVNNGFFDTCEPGTGVNASCTKPVSLMNKTGYEELVTSSKYSGSKPAGGSTGWLSTKAPVKPGETITLRFLVFDEGDGILDSAVLIDNFKWDLTAVQAPTTVDPGIN